MVVTFDYAGHSRSLEVAGSVRVSIRVKRSHQPLLIVSQGSRWSEYVTRSDPTQRDCYAKWPRLTRRKRRQPKVTDDLDMCDRRVRDSDSGVQSDIVQWRGDSNAWWKNVMQNKAWSHGGPLQYSFACIIRS